MRWSRRIVIWSTTILAAPGPSRRIPSPDLGMPCDSEVNTVHGVSRSAHVIPPPKGPLPTPLSSPVPAYHASPSKSSYNPTTRKNKNTPATSVKAMYTTDDQFADDDTVGTLPCPFTEDKAYAYLTRLSGSGIARVGAQTTRLLSFSNASVHCDVHMNGTFFKVRDVSGVSVRERSGINRRQY